MIELLSQTEAERRELNPLQVRCISPYINPGHVLSPPRAWLEGLVENDCTWHVFRLRYKNLLRQRYREDPERFHDLLRSSEGDQRLVLTCHCLSTHCHREIAQEFLERLRSQLGDPAACLPHGFLAHQGGTGSGMRAA